MVVVIVEASAAVLLKRERERESVVCQSQRVIRAGNVPYC
jgi:hypothetical protein